MDWIWGLLFAGAALLLGMFLEAKKTSKNESRGEAAGAEEVPQAVGAVKGHYQAKYLLTKNEWYEYKKLKEYAAAYQLQVCPKVRLLDIVEPRKGDNYMSYLGKIKSKHVDFLICDQNLHIKAILELDDGSHDTADRKARDTLVDEILQEVGYTVIHTRSITEATLQPLAPQDIQSTP